MKKTIQTIFIALAAACTVALGGIIYWYCYLPSSYYIEQGTELSIDTAITAKNTAHGKQSVTTVNASVGDSYAATLHWMGLFPVKEVTVTVVDERTVVVGGLPFGVKLYTDGVLVVSLSEVDTKNGTASPARKAGIRVGDSILSVNGTEVYTNEHVAELVKNSGGKPMEFRIKRDGVESTVRFQAAFSRNEQCYKAGLWVRDSSAGIGTMTFYDPNTKVFAGLGHAVCDVDTGDIVPISSGEIVPARIYSVTKSTAGSPGELRGGFDLGSYGPLALNSASGVYAVCSEGVAGYTTKIQLKQEIHVGEAHICTTINGKQPEWYSVTITQVRYRDENATRNMVIEITDKRLLEVTGGIVQGMSGSPIVQDGKLVGAITHVFVNDPTRGYAIFAENMLETAQGVAEEKLKDAS